MAKNDRVTMTEILVKLNGSEQEIMVLLEVADGPKKVLQSVRCKGKDKVALEIIAAGDQFDPVTFRCPLVEKVIEGFRNLVEDKLKAAFPGLPFKYTDSNTLLKFDKMERIWIEVKA